MSQPSPGPAEPVPQAAPVPYGPPVGTSGDIPTAAASIDLTSSRVAGTAGKWAIRLLLPLIIRAIFRAIFR